MLILPVAVNLYQINNNMASRITFELFALISVADDMDQDDGDETLGSDTDDRASETDSKKDGSRGTSRGSSTEGKSQGNASKPRR